MPGVSVLVPPPERVPSVGSPRVKRHRSDPSAAPSPRVSLQTRPRSLLRIDFSQGRTDMVRPDRNHPENA